MTTIPRPEYPRPHLERDQWLNLNGTWEFEFDDDNRGLKENWWAGRSFSQQIMVPFPFQSKVSGIGDTGFHDVVWYGRDFEVPTEWTGKRLLMHFGAVDYRAWVWINGCFAAYHEGGHTPFTVELTGMIASGKNRVVVRVEDPSTDLEIPRGKQFWEEKSKAIFYTRTTGIWQTVWLEPVGRAYLEKVQLTPDIDTGEVKLEYRINGYNAGQRIEAKVSFSHQTVAETSAPAELLQYKAVAVMPLSDFSADNLWSPEYPRLYQITVSLYQGDELLDEIHGYFGMRKISVENSMVCLNNRPYYMKLVLDQGYYPDGILSAPTDEDMKRDVELAKAMGFNGVRKHQKIEDPRYLYWADTLGLLVWGEMANAHTFTDRAMRRVIAEWQTAIERDYNHPSIVAWVPVNESWGVPRLTTDHRQPDHTLTLYHLTKSIDKTRLVISNDGWEHTKSDLCTIHDYDSDLDLLRERYSSIGSTIQAQPVQRPIYVPGYEYCNEPILVSEFGGIAYQKDAQEGWGYTTAQSDADFTKNYRDIITHYLSMPVIQGFCYTQLTDVEQEINGLLTYDRQPKIDLAVIRAINEGQLAVEN